MGDVVTKATEPALAAIKLAWWRERLEELDEGQAPAEPRLQAAAELLLPRGITGASLAAIEEGWAAWLDPQPDIERAGHRGVRLFELAARLLGAADPLTATAGRLYVQENARRRRLVDGPWPMDELNRLAGHCFARGLRPLTALAALAARDAKRPAIESEGSPGRAWVLIRHWLNGRVA